MTQQEREKRFDDKFTTTDLVGVKRLSMIVGSIRRDDEPYTEDDLVRFIKQFIQQEIDLAVKAREEEIIDIIRSRSYGWLGDEEDGSDRSPMFDECIEIIKLIKLTC